MQVRWRPNPGPQHRFLACTAYEALYGGAAGGGKTDSLVVSPLRWVGHPGFNGIIFRRTFPELEGQVIPKSRDIYPVAGGVYKTTDGGASWQNITGDLPYVKPLVLRFNSTTNELWAAGVGLFKIKQ